MRVFLKKTEKATCYAFNYLFNLQLKACGIMFFAFTDAGNALEVELKSFCIFLNSATLL